MSDSEGKAAIVTVHGTGDTADSDAGNAKWFQTESAFVRDLQARLSQQGIETDIIPHRWSGANSAWDRERAANKLAKRIRGLYNKYDSIHLVGHSHGGNVANDAAVLLKWGLRKDAKKERFDSLTTVGTPFFDLRTGPLQLFAGLLFVVLTWGAVIAFVPTLMFLVAMGVQATGADQAGLLIGVIAYLGLVGACLWFMLQMSTQGVRRILRPRTGGKTRTSVLSIWHPNDEAIAFLQRVEELPLEPFPRGAMFRGSRASAISTGVLVVIITSIAIPVLFAFGIDVLRISEWGAATPVIDPTTGLAQVQSAEEDAGYFAGLVIAVVILGLWIAPPLFTLTYLLFRYLVGGASEIGLRGTMNRQVVGILRGIAMGRDGDQVLCRVSPRSHTHATVEHMLTGECADRMKDGATGAAGRLIDKYRWALFSVGGDSSASLTSLTTDSMTWDSLIHTTYFDQPEVTAAVAEHIARTVRESAHAEAAAPVVSPPAAAPVSVAPVAEPAPAPVAEMEAAPPAEPIVPPTHEPPPDAAPQPA